MFSVYLSFISDLLFLQYGFNLERWILTGQQPVSQLPSCPPYWLMFSSPQGTHKLNQRVHDLWAPTARPRSHSMSSAEGCWLHHRSVQFLQTDSDEEGGAYMDNAGSCRERPRSAAARDPVSRVRDMHMEPSSPLLQDRRATSSPPGSRAPQRALGQHRSQQGSPVSQGQKNSKKRQRSLGRKFSTPACFSPSRPLQQRPSSAGSAVRSRRRKVISSQEL